MKQTTRILSAFLLVLGLASCRTTVPGPSYILRIAAQGSTPVQLSAIGTLQIEFAPGRPDLHFDMLPDTTLDGGVMLTTTAAGHFVANYPGDYIRAKGLATTTGFEVRLPFYSLDTTRSQNGYRPLVNVHVLDRMGTEFASGAGYVPWPLDTNIAGNSPELIAVSCKMGQEAICNPP